MNTQARITNFQDVIKSVTPVCDTNAYTAGDVLFGSTAIAITAAADAGPVKGRVASVSVLDKDDQTAAGMDLYFLRSNVALGTVNSAPNISDANAEEIVGRVRLSAGDFTDLGGCKWASLDNLNVPFQLTSGATLYVSAITAGAPTQSAAGIVVRVACEVQEGLI